MDFNATIDLIIKDLNEAREIIDDLKKYPGVPALQVELAKSKCKSAGEIIALIKTPDGEHPHAKEISVKPQPEIQPGPEPKSEPVIHPVSKAQPESEIEAKPLPKNEPEQKPQPKAEPLPSVHNKPKHQPADQAKEKDSSIVADRFTDISGSFHDKLVSKKKDDEVSVHIKSKHLTNLSDAIGLNDKFLFIREIFNNDKEAYNNAITRLDEAKNINDAMAVIMSYTGDNHETEAVTQLIELVKHKLLSNE